VTDAPRNGRGGNTVVEALPGLVRITAGAWLRTTEWALGASVRATTRVVRAAASGQSGTQLLEDLGHEIRGFARDVLGIKDLDDRVPDVFAQAVPGWSKQEDDQPQSERVSLRERGDELLRRSADVRDEEDAHPAYERILGELAPDEGRILRLLAIEGPQPAVDVRAGKTLVPGSSHLVAPGLSMLGAQAGARYVDRVPAYLNNLFRLGLIWFSREPLEPLRYQVLEAQPDVLQAMRNGSRARTVRRSIQLTPFGEDFCETCLPLHTAELDELPGDAGGTTEGNAPAGSAGAAADAVESRPGRRAGSGRTPMGTGEE
jgi:hypothetical protein